MYIRIDSLENGLRDLCGLKVHAEGYQLSHLIASDNLNLGISCVADSCNTIKITRDEWEKVALDSGASYKNIEIRCTDSREHKLRLNRRNDESEGHARLTWQQIESRPYENWDKKVLTIETSGKSVSDSFAELSEKLVLSKNSV